MPTITDKQIDDMLHECLHTAYRRPNEPFCFVDDPNTQGPPWLKEGDFVWWYELKNGMSLAFDDGMKIPFYTRWILCPKHKAELEKAGVTFDVESLPAHT